MKISEAEKRRVPYRRLCWKLKVCYKILAILCLLNVLYSCSSSDVDKNKELNRLYIIDHSTVFLPPPLELLFVFKNNYKINLNEFKLPQIKPDYKNNEKTLINIGAQTTDLFYHFYILNDTSELASRINTLNDSYKNSKLSDKKFFIPNIPKDNIDSIENSLIDIFYTSFSDTNKIPYYYFYSGIMIENLFLGSKLIQSDKSIYNQYLNDISIFIKTYKTFFNSEKDNFTTSISSDFEEIYSLLAINREILFIDNDKDTNEKQINKTIKTEFDLEKNEAEIKAKAIAEAKAKEYSTKNIDHSKQYPYSNEKLNKIKFKNEVELFKEVSKKLKEIRHKYIGSD